jgi:hypothetical protein
MRDDKNVTETEMQELMYCCNYLANFVVCMAKNEDDAMVGIAELHDDIVRLISKYYAASRRALN